MHSTTLTARARGACMGRPGAPRRGNHARQLAAVGNGSGSNSDKNAPIELVNGKVTSGPDLSVVVNGLKLPNPFVIGSGPPGTNYQVMKKAFDEGWCVFPRRTCRGGPGRAGGRARSNDGGALGLCLSCLSDGRAKRAAL